MSGIYIQIDSTQKSDICEQKGPNYCRKEDISMRKGLKLKLKVTTDNYTHNSCMTKHILPYIFNICYGIYLTLTDGSGIGMSVVNIMH